MVLSVAVAGDGSDDFQKVISRTPFQYIKPLDV